MSERTFWVFCFTQVFFLIVYSQRDSIISQALTICKLKCYQFDTCQISRESQACVSGRLFKFRCPMKCDTVKRPRRRYTCLFLVSAAHQRLLSGRRVDQPTRPVEPSEARENRHIKLSNSAEDEPLRPGGRTADKGNHHSTLSLVEMFENMTPIRRRDSGFRDAVCGTKFINPDMQFNPSSVHGGCSLDRGVLSNRGGVSPARRHLPHNKKHPQLKHVYGATADFEFSYQNLKMFFIEFNISISQNIGFVLEIALCSSHRVDKKSQLLKNRYCNGFSFKNKGKQVVTAIPKCSFKVGSGKESDDFRINGSITLGFFVNKLRFRFVLADVHKKKVISKCNKFRVTDDVRFVVKLNKLVQSTVRYKPYTFYDVC